MELEGWRVEFENERRLRRFEALRESNNINIGWLPLTAELQAEVKRIQAELRSKRNNPHRKQISPKRNAWLQESSHAR